MGWDEMGNVYATVNSDAVKTLINWPKFKLEAEHIHIKSYTDI